MMLTPERLAEIRHLLQEDGNRHDGAIVTYPRSLYTMRDMLAHIDAQQARIAELEGLLQSASNHCNDTANERNELRGQYASLLSLLAEIRIACGDKGKRMQDELVAYISELEQDAARYRWLKKYDKDNQCCFVSNIQYKEYDQEIDEAMQK